MKKLFALFLLAALTLSLAACDAVDTEQNDLYQTLAEYFGAGKDEENTPVLTSFALPCLDGETADPYSCADGAQKTLGALLYEGLFALDTTFTPQYALAESCIYDADKYTYTLTLHQDVLFSDGSELSASDVVYSLKRAAASVRYGARFADVASVSGSGRTVTIRLNCDNAALPARLDIPIIKSGTGGRTWPVGTGPYSYISDDSGAHLALNGHWWQKKSLPLSRIELVSCKDSDTMSYAFYSREIQLLVCDVTSSAAANVYGSGNYTEAATTIMHYIGVNTANEALSDAALRRALSLGIDRKSCIDAFLLGHGYAAQFPISPLSPLYPSALDVAYSPDNYDTAMAQCGFSGDRKLSLTLLVNKENSFKVDAARRIAEDLSHHGLTIQVNVLPWEEYLLALQAGDYDLYYGECRLTADWDLRQLVGTGGTLNYGAYSSAETDTLLSAYLQASDTQRPQAAETLCRHLAQESPILPVCFKSISVLLASDAVESITPTAANPFYDLSQWNIDIRS